MKSRDDAAQALFPINLRESFPVVVNPLLLVETKFAFTFGQEECIKTIDKTFTEVLFDKKNRELTRMIHRRVSHLRSQKFLVKKIRFPPAPKSVIGCRPKNVCAFVSPTNADWILIQKCRKKLSSVYGSSVRTVKYRGRILVASCILIFLLPPY